VFIYDRTRLSSTSQRELVAAGASTSTRQRGKLYLKNPGQLPQRTRSPKARFILDNYREELATSGWSPKDMRAPLNPKEGN